MRCLRRSPRLRPRRGSIYVLVLSMSTLLVVIAVSGLLVERVRQRSAGLEQGWRESGLLAEAAIEHAVDRMRGPWWREDMQAYQDAFGPATALGNGTMQWRFEDLIDNNLDDSASDPVRVHGLGRVGDAARVYSVVAWPSGPALDVLRAAAHASGAVDLDGLADVRGGPLSANGHLSGMQVIGDVEAASVDEALVVTGTATVPAPVKEMPAAALFDVYKSNATMISWGDLSLGVMQNTVLGPEWNPFNPTETNADGVYYVKPPSSGTLKLRNVRIEGTLVVELNGGSRLSLMEGVLWRPARSGMPALVVAAGEGSVVELVSAGELDEFLLGTNFNPPEVPYYGEADTDVADAYPASLRGLFHVIRTDPLDTAITSIDAPNGITGCVVVDGDLEITDGSKLVSDALLLSVPPLGYTGRVESGNLLQNGDMENGLAAWAPVGTTTTLKSEAGAHAGAAKISVGDRASAADGIRQDVTSVLGNGVPYAVDVWLEMSADPEPAIIRLETSSADGGTQVVSVTVPVEKTWTHVVADLVPTWSGDLLAAHWVVTTTTSTQKFFIDDASLTPITPGPPPAEMAIIPGTWRAEAAP